MQGIYLLLCSNIFMQLFFGNQNFLAAWPPSGKQVPTPLGRHESCVAKSWPGSTDACMPVQMHVCTLCPARMLLCMPWINDIIINFMVVLRSHTAIFLLYSGEKKFFFSPEYKRKNSGLATYMRDYRFMAQSCMHDLPIKK